MSDKRRLVYSIIQFCQKELQADDLSDDAKESLEVISMINFYNNPADIKVASQCLQSAYALNTEDKHLEVSKSLPAIFQEATKNEPVSNSSLKERVRKNSGIFHRGPLFIVGPTLNRTRHQFVFYFQLHKKSPPSAADKEEAERLKTEGNNLMRTEKFVEALEMYSKVGFFSSLGYVLIVPLSC